MINCLKPKIYPKILGQTGHTGQIRQIRQIRNQCGDQNFDMVIIYKMKYKE